MMAWSDFFNILKIVAPVILMVVPGGAALAPLVPLIVTGIADAQKKPGATGPEKKAFVMQLVSDAVVGANVVKPGTLDPATITDAADEAVDAVIATVQAVQTAHTNQPGVASIAVPITTSVPPKV
jgi:hypothetical protein